TARYRGFESLFLRQNPENASRQCGKHFLFAPKPKAPALKDWGQIKNVGRQSAFSGFWNSPYQGSTRLSPNLKKPKAPVLKDWGQIKNVGRQSAFAGFWNSPYQGSTQLIPNLKKPKAPALKDWGQIKNVGRQSAFSGFWNTLRRIYNLK